MAQRPLTGMPTPSMVSSLWFSFDSAAEDDKELWLVEQEVATELERVEQRHCETLPVGKSGNEVEESRDCNTVLLDDCVMQNPLDLQSYVDEDEEEEEDDDNDDDESESHDDDDEEIDMDVEDHDSPTF